MHLMEQLVIDSKNRKNIPLKIVAQRIIDLLDKWQKGTYGTDYFIFAHTFKLNVRLYKKGSGLNEEEFDKLDEIMEMLDNPKQ